MPPGTATVTRADSTIRLQSCDPGEYAAAPQGAGASIDSLVLPTTRTAIARALLKEGADHEQARCVAGKVVAAFPLDQLNDPDPDGATIAAIQGRIKEFFSTCA